MMSRWAFCMSFVLGIDTMIDQLTADIPNAEHGFKVIFSICPTQLHGQRHRSDSVSIVLAVSEKLHFFS